MPTRFPLPVIACLVCLASLPAGATTVPILSGTYTLTEQSICPIIATTTKNSSGDLTSIGTTVYGDASGLIATATFTPAAGTPNAGSATGTAYSYETGGLLQTPGGTLQPEGKAASIKTTYSTTATTLTLVGDNGVAMPSNVIYGTVKSGIVQSLSYLGPSKWPSNSTTVGTDTLVHN